MPRSVDEWVAKHDDEKIPPRVRVRVFERFGGVCQLTGLKIQAGDQWDVDHEKPLALGGEHREANLRPVLRYAHRAKSIAEVEIKAKADRVRKKHLGVHESRSRSQLPGGRASKWKKKVSGEVVPR